MTKTAEKRRIEELEAEVAALRQQVGAAASIIDGASKALLNIATQLANQVQRS